LCADNPVLRPLPARNRPLPTHEDLLPNPESLLSLKKLAVPLAFFALLLHLFAYYARVKRIEPFIYQFYIMVWWSSIILVDSLLVLKTRRFLILTRRLPSLVVLSVAFWCLFELLNLRLQNWFYVNVPSGAVFRFSGYFLAFGTVIPAIYLAYRILLSVLPEMRTRSITPNGYRTYAIPLGFLCLSLALAFPTLFFCLAWVFLAVIIDGHNYRKGHASFAADLERGSLKRLVAAGLSGMICGFLWEAWNYWSITKWIYSVPFFEHGKLFEMPVLGYLGFALFAVQTIAFIETFWSDTRLSGSTWTISSIALLFSILSFFFIDHYTVFSHTPLVTDLPFLSEASRESLTREGIRTSYAISPRSLSGAERDAFDLMHMKGLGARHLAALRAHGIRTITDLSRLDQEALSSILQEPNLRRVRVYLEAAKGHRASARGY
jgi:hypothetical protein